MFSLPHGDPAPGVDACIVSLENMLGRESGLADLPWGGHAWRQAPEAA